MSTGPVIAGTPVCPACERARDLSAEECPFCGIVYARYRPRLPAAALTPVEAPFGGTKLSGVGRENGKAAIEHYSELKTVYVATGPTEAAF